MRIKQMKIIKNFYKYMGKERVTRIYVLFGILIATQISFLQGLIVIIVALIIIFLISNK